jgi:hypothetical protein
VSGRFSYPEGHVLSAGQVHHAGQGAVLDRKTALVQRGWPICQPRDDSLVTQPANCLVDAGYTGMKTRKLGTICALLAATPWLIGCETSRGDSPNPQFQKQVQRAQECRQLQAKLVGDQPLTPERAAEITKAMNPTGCAARLPGYY